MLKTVFLSILFKKLEIYQILRFKWSYGQRLFYSGKFLCLRFRKDEYLYTDHIPI